MKQAAVLVPLLRGDEQAGDAGSVLLTIRAANLAEHGGQVSFPGGRIDATDASPEAAALREAWEEIGLDPSLVELLGRLPGRPTRTGYFVTPVIGRVSANATYTPAPDEVASIFTLPLSVVRDPTAPQRRRAKLQDDKWHEFWVWPHETHHIWGATATILLDLAAWLR